MGVIIVACCMLAFIGLAIPILVFSILGYNASHNTDKDISCKVCPTSNSLCSDNNSCTHDYSQFGGCVNPNMENGVSCTNACLTGAGSCNAGTCEGTCVGDCFLASDCPSIDGSFISAGNATCVNGGCIYTFHYALPTIFNSTCSTDSQILKDECLIGLSTTYSSCLAVDVGCDIADTITCNVYFGCTDWAFFII